MQDDNDPSERKTIDLCGEEFRPRMRCILPRGHTGQHECQMLGGIVTWKPPRITR